MKKLLDWFNNLPPQVKPLVAMAGLGSPVAIFYVIKKILFPKMSSEWAFLLMAGFLVAVSLLGVVVAWLFNRGIRRRRRDLPSKLIEGTETGAASISDREKIKANNKKFNDAVREMRKTLKVDVYDLPWYVVIGDSGCGKTRLINESELTFSAGKPEGYQLGTLDYNWWFTEDAIFIDMAGRLCNPQEDRDRREWLGVLENVAKIRKGFPINGVLACVSVEHLMNDSLEKQEEDANTMLERLRDLQQKLGVTFATYLVVTKCDKILGFMPFFDRTEHGATFKHQMFGWSRPGEFSDRYDPDHFDHDFDGLYGRLSDWRLRRLSDDSEEIELGLAYTFPEEFRSLREPLQIYVRKLFPLLKNPRGVKNLVFRGVYFTSATQKGEVILKHLRERLGADAGSDIPLLENLFPKPKAHFIKDLQFKKIFPEHGLVFRDEGQVHSNRRLARGLLIGSGVLAVLLVGLLWLSFSSFDKVIGKPRDHAITSTLQNTYYPASPADPASIKRGAEESLGLATDLAGDIDDLGRGHWAASVLGWGGAGKVVDHLKTIRLRLIEEGLLRQCLVDVEAALATAKLADRPDQVANYSAALAGYAKCYAGADQSIPAGALDRGLFEKAQPLAPEDAFLKVKWKELSAKNGPLVAYLDWLAGRKQPASLAQSALTSWLGETKRSDAIQAAVKKLAEYYRPYAQLRGSHQEPVVSDWMIVRDAWKGIDTNYPVVLGSAARTVGNAADFEDLRKTLFTNPASYTELKKAFDTLSGKKETDVSTLAEKIADRRKKWTDDIKPLKAEQLAPRGPKEAEVAKINAAAADASTSLDRELAKALDLKDSDAAPDIKVGVEAVNAAHAYVTDTSGGKLAPSKDATLVQQLLAKACDGLNVSTAADPAICALGPADWVKRLRDPAAPRQPAPAPAAAATAPAPPSIDQLAQPDKWKKPDLSTFLAATGNLAQRAGTTQVLNSIAKRLGEVGDWGWAELYPEKCDEERSPYNLRIADCRAAPKAGEAAPPARPADAPVASDVAPWLRNKKPAQPAGGTPREESLPQGKILAHRAFTRDFWYNCACHYAVLSEQLGRLGQQPEMYLPPGKDADPIKDCTDAAARAAQKYGRQYVAGWNAAYQAKIGELDTLLNDLAAEKDWPALAARFKPDNLHVGKNSADQVERLVGESLDWLLRSTRWLAWDTAGETWVECPGFNWEFKDYGWNMGEFVSSRTAPGQLPNNGPLTSKAAAGDVTAAWKSLYVAMALNADPKGRLNRSNPPEAVTIPWPKLQEIRDQYALSDELLTGRLVQFEKNAKDALSIHLTQILLGIQNTRMPGEKPLGGWPYLEDNKTASLRTVDREPFMSFLTDVAKARQALQTYEAGLADAAGSKERAEFYAQCERWAKFLFGPGGNEALLKGDAKYEPLLITAMDWVDPIDAQTAAGRDTPQHFYRLVELQLGLTPEKGLDDPQKIPTAYYDRAQKRKAGEEKTVRGLAVWDWRKQANPPTVAFTDAITVNQKKLESKTDRLGEPSDFAFCAYLFRYRLDSGRPFAGDEFITEHWIGLQPSIGDIKEVGVRIKFRLDRPIPAPITILKSVEPRAAQPAAARTD